MLLIKLASLYPARATFFLAKEKIWSVYSWFILLVPFTNG